MVKLSQALGRFEGRLNRLVGRTMLRRCVRVFARGGESFAMARALGLGDVLDRAPDVALAYDAGCRLTKAVIEPN